MSTIDACRILTIKYSLPVVTNMAQKQNENCGCMWNSDNKHSQTLITNMAQKQKQNEHPGCMRNFDNQALTYCDHKHGTEAE